MARVYLQVRTIFTVHKGVNSFIKEHIIYTCKYGHLWQPIVLTFGYGRYSEWQNKLYGNSVNSAAYHFTVHNGVNSFIKEHIISNPKYDCLWQLICLPFGYGRLRIREVFRMTNMRVLFAKTNALLQFAKKKNSVEKIFRIIWDHCIMCT